MCALSLDYSPFNKCVQGIGVKCNELILERFSPNRQLELSKHW